MDAFPVIQEFPVVASMNDCSPNDLAGPQLWHAKMLLDSGVWRKSKARDSFAEVEVSMSRLASVVLIID